MAKRREEESEERQRRSRKEILIARKEREQKRRLYLGVGGLALLLLAILAVAIVNEFVIAPNRAVATVNDEEITLAQWQRRVEYERAQLITILESQLEALGGDVGTIQQFFGQAIIQLQDAEGLGQDVLNQMVEEAAACQALADRDQEITAADIDQASEERFNYFGGASPTRLPTSTPTIQPTPSLTPIPTPVITDVVPTATAAPTLTPAPTGTPLPTATPVSQESYEEQFSDYIADFEALGVTEATYREALQGRLCQQRLTEVLAEEQSVPQEAEMVSAFFLSYDDEESAAEAREAMADGDDYLQTWNSVRSAPPGGVEEGPAPVTAFEILWRTRDNFEELYGEEIAETAFAIDVGEPSDVVSRVEESAAGDAEEAADDSERFLIIQVSGRDIRPLDQATIDELEQQTLVAFTDEFLATGLELSEFWRGRVPTVPILDSKFLAPPTPTPVALEDEVIPLEPETSGE